MHFAKHPSKRTRTRYITKAGLPYHQYGHIVGVASVAEPAKGADVVPTSHDGGEGSSTEGSAVRSPTGPSGHLAVEGGGPGSQGLGQTGHYRARGQADVLQRLRTVWW